MLDWKIPTKELVPDMQRIVAHTGAIASDACVSNIFLLRNKYDIRVAIKDGFLFRWYSGSEMPGRNGVAFPLGKGDVKRAINCLIKDRNKRGLPAEMILLNKDQKEYCTKNGIEASAETHESNWDYIYKSEHLARLEGKENSKKRNRVSRFTREYPDWRIEFTDTENNSDILNDMLRVEDEWLTEQEERAGSVLTERDEIHEAVSLWDELPLSGGVIYVEDKPVAMTIASEISKGTFDILFEKSYGEYAQAGGFAAINKYFADHLHRVHGAQWINREEDIGMPGLRRAKMAYHPDIRLEKYQVTLGSC